MKTICTAGYKISSSDKKALEHFLLDSPFEWSKKALNGLINKAIKSMLDDYYDIYKSEQTENVSTDLNVIIPQITKLSKFKAYETKTPKSPIIDRKKEAAEEIWCNGFEIEDYEETVIKHYFQDIESYMIYLIENKIYNRRKAMIKEYILKKLADKSSIKIPAHDDDIIDEIVKQPEYKNRRERDQEVSE